MTRSRYSLNRHPEHQYLDLLRELIDAPSRQTRNDTATRSVFGRQMRFDLEKGFPLLTTKRVSFRLIALELLWFLSGSTNAKWLEDQGCNIWKEWKRPYALSRPVELVEARSRPYSPYCGDFSTLGIDASANSEDYDLSRVWVRMMRRCYDSAHHRFRFYGAKGVSVAPEWHDPARFIADARHLPHWEYKQEDWSAFDLDKDYYGANQYGPGTSVWLREDENGIYTSAAKPILVVRPDGTTSLHLSVSDAARKTGWADSSLRRYISNGPPSCYKGANRAFEGWTATEIDFGGKLARHELIRPRDMGPIYGQQFRAFGGDADQVAQVLQGLRDDPYGRRHVLTLWNPADLPDMALPPCHGIAIQFYVGADERLNLFMHQRSGDAFLGVPFNIASYALLLEMFASVLGRRPGEFVHSIGDLHLYGNHVDQAQQQVLREPRPLPVVEVRPGKPDMDSWALDDLRLFGYDPWPKIAGEVSA